MAATLTTPNTLSGVFVPQTDAAKLLKQLAMIVIGTGLLTIAAKVQVPLPPVAFTLQSLVVALIAGAAGWRIGVATVALYIAEGLSGLPVFSTGGGLDYVLRPSFGFILGWLPMAYVIGRAADRGVTRNLGISLIVMLLADAISFVFGFVWLMVVASIIVRAGGTLPTWIKADDLVTTAWKGAVQPFIVWDAVKMLLAAFTVFAGWGLVPKSK